MQRGRGIFISQRTAGDGTEPGTEKRDGFEDLGSSDQWQKCLIYNDQNQGEQRRFRVVGLHRRGWDT